MTDNNMRIIRMPPLDSEWMSDVHRTHTHKPTHFANGTERPATTKKKKELKKKWCG